MTGLTDRESAICLANVEWARDQWEAIARSHVLSGRPQDRVDDAFDHLLLFDGLVAKLRPGADRYDEAPDS